MHHLAKESASQFLKETATGSHLREERKEQQDGVS